MLLLARYARSAAKTLAAQNGEFEDLVGFALITRYEKESRVENSFSTAPGPSRFSPRNMNRPASVKLKG